MPSMMDLTSPGVDGTGELLLNDVLPKVLEEADADRDDALRLRVLLERLLDGSNRPLLLEQVCVLLGRRQGAESVDERRLKIFVVVRLVERRDERLDATFLDDLFDVLVGVVGDSSEGASGCLLRLWLKVLEASNDRPDAAVGDDLVDVLGSEGKVRDERDAELFHFWGLSWNR